MKKIILSLLVIMTFSTLSGQEYKKFFSDTTLMKSNLWEKDRSTFYTHSVDEENKDFRGYFYRGIKKLEDSLFLEAIDDFKLSITKDKYYSGNIPSLDKQEGKVEALYYIGMSFNGLQNEDSAFYYLNKTIEVNPHYLKAYTHTASIYHQKGELDKMEAILKKGVIANPKSPAIKYQLGAAYLFQNKISKTKKILAQIIDEFPNYEDAYTFLGIISVLERNYSYALSNFSKAIEINPDNAQTYGLRGMVYKELENNLGLYKDFTKSYELDSANFPSLSSLAALDIKYGNDSVGLSRVCQVAEKNFSDSIKSSFTNPKELEYYYLMKVIVADTLPSLELTYIKSFFYDYYWETPYEGKKLLDEYIHKNPHSLFAERFWLFVHFDNRFRDEFILGNEELQTKYKNLADSFPEIANLSLLAAEIYSETRNEELSIEYYKKGLQLLPRYVFANTAIAEQFYNLSNYDSAAYYYDKAIEVYPENAEIHFYKAQSLIEIPSRITEGIAEFKLSLDLESTELLRYEIQRELATSYTAIEQYDSAIVYLDKLLSYNNDNTELLEKRGFAFLQLKEYHHAINTYNKALAIYNRASIKDPSRVNAYFDRGNAYYYLGQYHLALDDYNEALKIQPKDPIFKGAVGDCYRNLADYDKAIKNYESAIEGVPDNKWYYYKKSLCFTANLEYMEAIMGLTNAIVFDSTFSEAYAQVGWNYYKLEKYKRSITFSNEALKHNPNLSFASMNIGLSLIRLGYFDKAYEIFSHISANKDQISKEEIEACVVELKELLYINEYKNEARQILVDLFQIQV